jgi:hypothetical protein
LATKKKRACDLCTGFSGETFSPKFATFQGKKDSKLPFLDYRFLQLLVNSGDSINFLLFSLTSTRNWLVEDPKSTYLMKLKKKTLPLILFNYLINPQEDLAKIGY